MSVIPSIGTTVVNNSSMPTLDGNTLYVGGSGPDNYTSIQEAINDANPGDTVFVYNGTYYEHLDVHKRVNLAGEDKESTFIDGGGSLHVVEITANWVDISGFTIQNSSSNSYAAGIYFRYKDYNRISGNIIKNNKGGIFIESGANHNNISWNHITDCYIGIHLSAYSNDNVISGNTVKDNSGFGIYLYGSDDNNILGNEVTNNRDGIYLVISCDNNIILGNTVANNNGYYGISLAGTPPSNNNVIYHNNIISNRQNGRDLSNNVWDNGYPSGGNYWDDFDEPSEGAYDDYHGENQDCEGGDGIVDQGPPTGGLNPYNLPGGSTSKDWYPLIKPYHFIPLEITDVTLTTSDPLDTESGFGWENVTCTVTDIVAVNEVKLFVTYPDTTTVVYMMTNISSTDTYYYNLTLLNPGNYTYHIWANDTSGNGKASESNVFYLPSNCDVDMSGKVHFMDLIAVSAMYDQTCPGYPTGGHGWVRADVDNNGHVHFMDLIGVSGHYGQTWKP